MTFCPIIPVRGCREGGHVAVKVLLFGCGRVGRAFCELLGRKRDVVESASISLVGVATRSRGCVFNSHGIDVDRLLQWEALTGRIDALESEGTLVISDANEMLEDLDYDILVECTPSDFEIGEPARSIMKKAIKRGKHVVTANTGAMSLHFDELTRESLEIGVKLLYEATVLSGTPLFSLVRHGLPGCCIRRFEGILNGTCNFVLTVMGMGSTFDEALLEAQRRGLPEQNPWVDIDGLEAAAKTAIVARSLMSANVDLKQASIKGIRNITAQNIEEAKRRGGKLKLLSRIEANSNEIHISVSPEILSLNHPLAHLEGFSIGALLLTDVIGEICISGSGSGPKETSYSLLKDVLSLREG